MKPSILITGASGFVGQALLAGIEPSRFKTIFCLKHHAGDLFASNTLPKNVVPVTADLLDPSSYASILDGVDTVIHLAAQTGKAKPRDYFRINVEGTRLLLEASKQAGVKKFLFVSSIAAKFKKVKRYYYAQSKQAAEDIVKDAGLRFTILRPTMIFGEGSPIVAAFSRFARLPIVPLFGGGKTLVQPVHVRDVVLAILSILDSDHFNGETFELGGADVVSIKELYDLIRRQTSGDASARIRTVTIPMGMTVGLLTLVEPLLYGILPITVGQLATFRNDGRAESHRELEKLLPQRATLDKMLSRDVTPPDSAEMATSLQRECEVFCRYLIGQNPDNYVQKKYRDCHLSIDLQPSDRFDSFLVKWAIKGSRFSKCCDAYSRLFNPNSLLRKKLVYLLAILETSPQFCSFFDRADEKNRWLIFFQIGLKGGIIVLALLVSSPFLFPVQKLLQGKKGNQKKGVHDG